MNGVQGVLTLQPTEIERDCRSETSLKDAQGDSCYYQTTETETGRLSKLESVKINKKKEAIIPLRLTTDPSQ